MTHAGQRILQHFETRQAILRDWPDYYDKTKVGPSSPPNIVLAIILANQGKTDDARDYLEKQNQESQHAGHKEYVRDLAKRLGLRKS